MLTVIIVLLQGNKMSFFKAQYLHLWRNDDFVTVAPAHVMMKTQNIVQDLVRAVLDPHANVQRN